MRNSEAILGRWPFLQRAWERQRIAQSLLLVGSGTYAVEAAQAVIRQQLCEGEGSVSCSCRSCRALGTDSHPDLVQLRPDPKTIRLDAVLRAIARASVAPLWSKTVVVWVTSLTAMHVEGENALLKSLEEPPDFAQYVLSVERVDGVLPTIRSRCQTVSVEAPVESPMPFDPTWFGYRDRNLAEDLVAAAYTVRAAFQGHEDPRLFDLFSMLWRAREGTERNHNLDLVRTELEMAWEGVFRGR
jgi:hypothetical protein